jgi:hypothetical protein
MTGKNNGEGRRRPVEILGEKKLLIEFEFQDGDGHRRFKLVVFGGSAHLSNGHSVPLGYSAACRWLRYNSSVLLLPSLSPCRVHPTASRQRARARHLSRSTDRRTLPL